MARTQISLSVEELQLLDAAARVSGASRAELIRRAIRAQYSSGARRGETSAERRALARSAFGAWKDRSFTGEEYVRAIRSGDMNENLRRIGA